MKTNLIAEVAQAHDGSLGMAHSFIDAIVGTGIQTIKFQIHIAEAESSIYEEFRVPFSYEDKSRYDYWKRMEFTFEEWQSLKNHCDDKNIEFLASPFSIQAVELLEKLGVKRYKIGSGEINNHLMLDQIAATRKPILLSNGLAGEDDIMTALNHIRNYHDQITILQCTTAYPTMAKDLFLLNISELKNKYNVPIGYSDHSSSIYPLIAAMCLGAEVLEFHVCYDKRMFGPDAIASLTIEEVSELVKAIQLLEQGLQIGKKDNISDLQRLFGKSLAVRQSLYKGDIILVKHLESKKPFGKGIPAKEYTQVVGRKLKHDISANNFLNWSDIENE